MYVDEAAMTSALRQGDVISSVHILGAINLGAIQYTGTPNNLGKEQYQSWQMPNPPTFRDAMVLSHSCEIAVDNDVKLTSIILAPIRDAHTATSSDRLEELKTSNFIDREQPQVSYLKYFYLQPHPRFEYQAGAIVDFSKCFSVRKNSYGLLADKKIAELHEDARESMSLKLSLYFYRSQEAQAA
jgi:hypothetical protein